MSLKHRYLKDSENNVFDYWWYDLNGDVVAVSDETPFDKSDVHPSEKQVPEGFTEIEESEYNTIFENNKTEDLAEFKERYDEAKQTQGVIESLIDKADDIIGGIL